MYTLAEKLRKKYLRHSLKRIWKSATSNCNLYICWHSCKHLNKGLVVTQEYQNHWRGLWFKERDFSTRSSFDPTSRIRQSIQNQRQFVPPRKRLITGHSKIPELWHTETKLQNSLSRQCWFSSVKMNSTQRNLNTARAAEFSSPKAKSQMHKTGPSCHQGNQENKNGGLYLGPTSLHWQIRVEESANLTKWVLGTACTIPSRKQNTHLLI